MKRTSPIRRLLAFAMAVAICFSLVPWTVFAAETGTYTQVKTAEEFTSGQYVLIADNGYAPGVLDSGWLSAAQPTVADGAVTDAAGAVWTLTVENSSVKLTDANGVTVAPKGGNTNGIISGDYSWAWTFESGKFTFAGTGEDTVVLASNVSSSNKFRAYKTATVSGNPAGYPCAFTAYKLVESAVDPEPSEPEETAVPSEPEETTEPAVVISTIAEARAMASGTESITVEGTVIRVSGKNVVVQDATAGINLYFSAAPSDIAVGDVIRATGNRGAYNGLEQLTGVAEYTKTGTAQLPVKEVTIAEILADQDTAALESTRVLIKGATLGATSGKNTALTQADATINIYGMPTLEGIQEGDTVEVIAIVGDFKGYQLNVNTAADVTKVVVDNTPAWNDVDAKYDVYELVTAPASGDVVVIYNPGNAKALSSEDSSYYKAGVEPKVAGETYIASDSDFIAWTVGIDAEGLYTFTQNDLKLGVEKSGSYLNLKTNAGDYNFVVTALTEGGDLYTIRSSTVENDYGFAYINWYGSKNAFSVYATSEDKATEQNYGFKFYKLVREGIQEEEPTEPEIPEEPAGNTATLVTDVADLKAGDRIIIVASDASYALGTTQNNNNRAQAEVTKSEDGITVTYGEDTQVITLEAGLAESTWAFQVGGYLYAASSSKNYLRTEESLTANSSWTLEIAEGVATIKATGENTRNWLRHNSNSSIFACYASGQNNVSIYKLDVAEEEEPEVPAAGIADGDYVIWAPAYNMALSSVYPDGSYYNAGVAVTMENDTLSGYGKTEIWTVRNNEDGTITISFGGQNLGLADSYSSMSLGAVNDTWTLEDAGNGLWYVKNVVRGNYMEWYADKNNWSSYYKISEGSEGLFALQFTPVEEASGIADGDYVIWAPAYNKALSSVKTGNYNVGVDVTLTGEVLSGYGATEIWTVKNNEDGTITITQNGSVLSMAAKYSSLTMDEVNNTWTLIDLGEGLFNVQNVGRGNYLEWYNQYSNWSTYNSSSAATDGQFQIMFTPAVVINETVIDSSIVQNIAQWGGLTKAENTAFVYGDKYVSGDEKDVEDIFTAVVSGAAVTPYTVGGNSDAPLYYMGGAGLGSGTDDYLQFAVNAAGWGNMELSLKLRASNSGPGSFQVQYSADNGATWQNFTTGMYSYVGYNTEGSYAASGEITDGIAKTSYAPGKYVSFVFDVPAGADNCGNLLIRLVPGTEKANGKTGAISATGTTRVEGVVLSGSPVISDGITGFVTVEPDGTEDQPAGTALTMTSKTEGATIYYRVNGGEWTAYDPENKPALETLPCDIEAYAVSEGKADSVVLLYHYAAGTVETVKFSPNGGGIYIEGETYEITLSTATEGAVIYYATSADGETFTAYAEYTAPIVVNKGFQKLTIKAYAVKDGYKDSAESVRTFTERSSDTWQLYFGQLHAHTSISDGAGTIEEAYAHAAGVEGLDFLAVTDHSNSFDNEGSGVLAEDGSLVSEEWKQAKAAAEAITQEGEFVGLYGFEMTWSGGSPGHINTFNTPGWQSRTQSAYKDKSVTALQNYYDALATVPESISQFNHPGTTFGDFFDFGCYSEGADNLITLIEVGNGEGAIGSSGYFPSYEYYTRALDKGWHVAPTNNQDNHKGMWGNANTGRTVILADFLSEEAIYDALRNYRVYATEDSDLQIYYALNGYTMGTILDGSDVEENVTISVTVIDSTDGLSGTLEVIVNGGLAAASYNLGGSTGTVELTVPADYNYYYIKVTQADGDIAVTAPVWVGEIEAVGISSLETATDMTIAGEEQTILAELFNNESKDLVVESLVYTNKATGEVLYTDASVTSVPSEATASSSFSYTFRKDGIYTITATLKGTLNGVEKTYTKDLEITVMPENITSRIIVDGTHFNDYVSGYYAGNMNNMTAIAGAQGIDVHVETEKITPEMLENCSLLVISAPNTRTGETYPLSAFEEDFVALVAQYVKNGGSVILCGIADYQDKQNDGIHETSVQLNNLLTAIGSSMRINDDEAYDEVNFSNQNYRLYPNTFNMDSKWCAGLVADQVYSQYSGCTVDPGNGTWLVKGFDTTYSIDSDKDGKGGVAQGEAVFMAAEDTGFGGTVFVTGGVFLSDFEVKAEMDNIWDLPYANRTIYENIIGITRSQPEITPIADVRDSAEAELGHIFVIEGYVTAGTANPDTTFFDAIYVQDETGGITVFPYSEPGLELGTKVRITGFTDSYQGDIEIQVMSLEILDAPKNVIAPEKVSAKDAMDYAANGGELLQVEGEVVEVILGTGSRAAGQSVSQFVVKDENGNLAKVFIDGYILSGTTGANTLADIVKVGNTVSAVGLLYMHPEGDSETSVAVLRVRDCDEVVLIKEKVEDPAESETDKTELEKAIQAAKSKKAKDYTKKSFDAMQEALKKAEEVFQDENATQEEINAATDALNAAIKTLVPNTGKNPETSDSAYIELSLFVMTVSLLAVAVLLAGRKRFAV